MLQFLCVYIYMYVCKAILTSRISKSTLQRSSKRRYNDIICSTSTNRNLNNDQVNPTNDVREVIHLVLHTRHQPSRNLVPPSGIIPNLLRRCQNIDINHFTPHPALSMLCGNGPKTSGKRTGPGLDTYLFAGPGGFRTRIARTRTLCRLANSMNYSRFQGHFWSLCESIFDTDFCSDWGGVDRVGWIKIYKSLF